MGSAREAFDSLDEPWQLALGEAWTSWASGSAGVAAAIAAADGQVLATGRNRIADERREPGVLASSLLAHAEMNALAVLPLGRPESLIMTTTFEP